MFKFDEKAHRYTLDGKALTGVTTILNVIAKPNLIQWSANMAVGHIEKAVKSLERKDLEELDWGALFEEAKTAHRRKKESAGDIGTEVHKAVEEWIKDKKQPELDPQGMRMFNHFINWTTENNVKFLASEERVYSRENWYAGTYDFLCEIDGKRYIGDLKTSNGIYGREYFFQMAGYEIARREMGQTPVEGSIVVRCGKKGDFETKESFDFETDSKGFLSALHLYRALETYKVNKK